MPSPVSPDTPHRVLQTFSSSPGSSQQAEDDRSPHHISLTLSDVAQTERDRRERAFSFENLETLRAMNARLVGDHDLRAEDNPSGRSGSHEDVRAQLQVELVRGDLTNRPMFDHMDHMEMSQVDGLSADRLSSSLYPSSEDRGYKFGHHG